MDRKIRRSQCITPFGVGAIIDIGQESFIAEDISKWKNDGEIIELKRLSARLRVDEFRMPPVPNDNNRSYQQKIPFRRFPEWLFCSICDHLQKWPYSSPQFDTPKCTNKKCNDNKLTPMRFVMACKSGHLSDVDWARWVHSNKNITDSGRCDIEDKLTYGSVKNSSDGGLGSIEIRCEACNSSRSLAGITSKDAVKSMGVKCSNKQPWESIPQESYGRCEETPLVVQKGASNLYFPKIISALDIPLNNNEEQINDEVQKLRQMSEFRDLKEAIDANDKISIEFYTQKCRIGTGLKDEEIQKIANEDLLTIIDDDDEQQNKIAIEENEILIEEWPVLIKPIESKGANYESREELFNDVDNFGLDRLFKKLILIPKLREVRALRGFNRIEPTKKDFISAGLDLEKKWLSAIEVFGEGIFIQFSEEEILKWINNNKKFIKNRIGNIQDQYDKKELSFLTSPPTARYLLLHTFSHLLIRQLSFECGYSESSLRERIYANDGIDNEEPMAGILIYTADSDSEGSLGGLVRQGKKDRFIATVMIALERGSWCSGDPVCKELDGQGMMGLNRAACHACALLSETSCVNHNIFLDRILAIGDAENPFGFFSDAIKKFRS